MYIRLIEATPNRYSPNQLRREYPNISFPAVISEVTLGEFDVFPLVATPLPEADLGHRVEEGVAEFIGGQWTQTWVQVPLTPEEIADRAADQAAARKQEREQQSLAALEVVADLVIKPLLDTMADTDVDSLSVLFPDFIVGEGVVVGDVRNFGGVLYKVLQDHITQADWTPPVVPALWVRVKSPGSTEWVAGIAVAVGEDYTYEGITYTVVQSHTTQAGWEPPNVPALWSVA